MIRDSHAITLRLVMRLRLATAALLRPALAALLRLALAALLRLATAALLGLALTGPSPAIAQESPGASPEAGAPASPPPPETPERESENVREPAGRSTSPADDRFRPTEEVEPENGVPFPTDI
jgi:hypothetical protein